MKVLVRAVVAAAALGASAAASAASVDLFDFSYTFGDGQQVSGAFIGTTSDGGQSVTGITSISASLDGIAFAPVTSGGTTTGNATLQLNAWNPSLGNYDDTTPVTIYANGSLNNFIISDVDAATTTPDYYFTYVNDSTNGIFQALASNFLQTVGGSTQLAIDSPGIAGSWKLTEVAPVPIPAALPLLVSGLGLLGFARRRRAA